MLSVKMTPNESSILLILLASIFKAVSISLSLQKGKRRRPFLHSSYGGSLYNFVLTGVKYDFEVTGLST